MNWNLFLGIVPLFFAWLYQRNIGGKFTRILWFTAWILFLPNAPYMITDFIHIADIGPRSIHWYDGLMLFGYAWSGILVWIHTTAMMYTKFSSKLFVPIVALFTAIGLYLGRYIRFNSWDMILKPVDILNQISDTFTQPLDHEPFLLFTTVFWVFLMLIYVGHTNLHGISVAQQQKKES